MSYFISSNADSSPSDYSNQEGCSRQRKDKETIENKAVKIYSADFDIYEEAEEVKQLEYNGNIDLAKAAIRQIDIQGGLEIITRSNAPAGSGLADRRASGRIFGLFLSTIIR